VDDTWRKRTQITPSVALALINTISNVCLAVAIGQGVAIAWWRKALKGSTVEDLHRTWGFSSSVLELLTAGRSFNLVALAALMAKLALVDNLLLQRAAGSGPGIFTRYNVPINLPLVSELPPQYAGEFALNGATGALSDEFSSDLYHYATVGDIVLFNDTWAYSWNSQTKTSQSSFSTRCEGTCQAIVPGFGFSVDCADPYVSPSFNISPSLVSQSTLAHESNQTFNAAILDPNFSRTILSVNATTLLPGQTFVDSNGETQSFSYASSILNVTYARNVASSGDLTDLTATTCNGRTVWRTCVLRPAIVNYPITVTNITSSKAQNGIRISPSVTGNLTFLDRVSTGTHLENGQIPGITIAKNAYEPYNATYDTNIQAVTVMINSLFSASVNLDYINGTNGGYVPTASSNAQLSSWWEGAFAIRPFRKSCLINVVDPLPWIVSQVNSIMLRASIAAAVDQDVGSATWLQVKNGSVQQNINSVEIVDSLIYESHYSFMFGALATMLFCICCVLPSYWGFWQLGRKVTLVSFSIRHYSASHFHMCTDQIRALWRLHLPWAHLFFRSPTGEQPVWTTCYGKLEGGRSAMESSMRQADLDSQMRVWCLLSARLSGRHLTD
jgi:hypothetical protein